MEIGSDEDVVMSPVIRNRRAFTLPLQDTFGDCICWLGDDNFLGLIGTSNKVSKFEKFRIGFFEDLF